MASRKSWFLKVSIPVLIGLGLVFVLVSRMVSPVEVSAEIAASVDRGAVSATSSTTVIPLEDNFILYDGGDEGSDYVVRGKPAIQFDGSNFLAAWMDVDTGEMMASRVTSDGVRLDAPPITVSQASNPGMNPSVGFDGTNYLVVWVATDWEIYAARIAQDGTLLDPGGVKLTTGSNALPRMLGIAYDGTNYLVVWRVGSYGSEVRGTRVAASGSQPVNLDSASGFSISEGDWSRYPAVAYGDGVYLVAWHKGDCGGGNQSIQAARVSIDGAVLDPANFIVNDGDGCQEQAVVGWDGRNFQVAWNNWYMATGKWYASGSATRVTTNAVILDTPAITLSNYVRGEKPFGIACNGQNCLYTWDVEHDAPFNWRLTDAYARRIDQDGNVIEEQAIPVSAASGHQFGPMVAHGDGRYLVLWDDRRDNGDRAIIAGQILQSVPGSPEPTSIAAKIEVAGGIWIEEYLSADASAVASSGVALSAGEAYAFGKKGGYHYSSGSWSALSISNPQSFYESWAFAPDDLWAGGWCRSMFHYDGTSWSMECWTLGDGDWGRNTYGIWGHASDQIWASADRGHIIRYNPYHPWIEDSWEDMETPTGYDLYDLWGAKWYDMLSVGDRGTVIHYNGDAWNLVDGVPTLQSLNAIWGYDAGHVFVVGDWGTILYFDGENWMALPSGTTEHLVDIWGRNPHDIYAVGLHGTLLHYDGSNWTIEDTGRDVDFLSVWGYADEMTGSTTVWIGTRSNLVLRQTMPSAAFIAAPTSGYAPITTGFTNTSASGHTSLLWDFGDGITSTMDSPTHTYSTNGAYTVTLDVIWPDGSDSAFKPGLVQVYEYAPVSISFTVVPTISVFPMTVWFTGTVEGDYDEVLWDFGDGYTGTQAMMTHTYESAGYFNVEFSAQGPGGMDHAFRLNQVNVRWPAGPFFEQDISEGYKPLAVTFSGTCGGEYETGTFDFGDGESLITTSFNLTHTYPDPGLYFVVATCTGPWNTGTWDSHINVWDTDPPTATLTANPISGTAPLSVSFGGGCEGYYKDLLLDFGVHEGGTNEFPTAHEYLWPGVYTATLSCAAPAGSSWATETITVTDPPGAPTATFSADVISGTAPLTVTFTADPNGTVEHWLWSFGDGDVAFTGPVVTHTYVISDTFDVSLTVSSTHGSSVTSKPSYITVWTEDEGSQYSIFLPLVLRSTP